MKWVTTWEGEIKLDNMLNSSSKAIAFRSPPYSHTVQFVGTYMDELFQAFQMPAKYNNSAQYKLHTIKDNYTVTRSGKIQYVSIHVRRGDVAPKYGKFIPAEYFNGAINLMQNHFFPKDDIAFVVVTGKP